VTPRARRVRIDLAYDGTDYCGWQLQPNRRTVQGVVEQALAKLHGSPRVIVRGAGRTDSGVHAHGQVADCEVRLRLDDDDLAYALGRLLPADVRPLRVRSVTPEFHSRKSAVQKSYRYRIDRTAMGDPFTRRFALHHPVQLDEARIREALCFLPGAHDWTGFTTPRSDKEDAVRRMTVARLDDSIRGEIGLVFEADGFLRYMVRNLVGILLEIGKGHLPVERIPEVLESGDHERAGPTAASRGLHLMKVEYARRDSVRGTEVVSTACDRIQGESG
jgi:tRNA pseudouridine38-40 synthase